MPPRITKPVARTMDEAASLLRRGDVVAFPTETVYGLGADTFHVSALRRVYELKGRPADNPLIAHVQDVSGATRLVQRWDARCEALARRFWPGPLTLVVAKAGDVPAEATAGLATIAVRCPDHPVAQALLRAFGGAISAPSANRSGGVSPTTAHHVADDFQECEELLILDGGPCGLGIESTVVDMTGATPRVLRPGAVTVDQLRDVVGDVDEPMIRQQEASPGTSAVHYAPRAAAVLVSPDELHSALRVESAAVAVLCFNRDVVPPPHFSIKMPDDAAAYATRLYSALREAEAMAPAKIIIERPPKGTGEWAAIHDRLRRATGG